MSDWTTAQQLLICIPLLPLLAAVLTAVLGPRVLQERSHWPAILAIGTSAVLSFLLLSEVSRQRAETPLDVGYATQVDLWTWASIPAASADEAGNSQTWDVRITLRADGLTCIMLAMVTFIATLVAVYAGGYMRGDPGYWRFFCYVSLFVFSMTMLVSVSNFLLLYVFWEAVGVCSYLLIGFWYEKPSAAAAGKKAFLVNRVGDFGFALGIFLIWTTYGTLNFHDTAGGEALRPSVAESSGDQGASEAQPKTAEQAAALTPGVLGQTRLEAARSGSSTAFVGGGVGVAIALLLFVGACGKSAQVPLHVWLPDAMEGPTPVSALIHAATMVTAGVYLVARCTPLFMIESGQWVDPQLVVAIVGATTAALAGIIAMTQNDLKRVLAYSTVSQLGYMFLALGTGSQLGIVAGMFHLVTHAFFKALLFLGSGSVMHAMGGVIDMRRFGGLRLLMPITYWTFIVGGLALAGVWPFAGFFSKDLVIETVYEQALLPGEHAWLYRILTWVAFGAAFLTAVYTARAVFKTFHGPLLIPADAGHHAHESPASMTVPLGVLAVGAMVVVFLLGVPGPGYDSSFGDMLRSTPSLAYLDPTPSTDQNNALLDARSHATPTSDSVLRLVAAEGAGAAGHDHAAHHGEHHVDHDQVKRVVTTTSIILSTLGILLAAFLFHGDNREASALAKGLELFGLFSLSNKKFYFDEIYQALIVRPLQGLAAAFSWVDRWLVDGLVNLIGKTPSALAGGLRAAQNGLVQLYASMMVLGVLAIVAMLIWFGVRG